MIADISIQLKHKIVNIEKGILNIKLKMKTNLIFFENKNFKIINTIQDQKRIASKNKKKLRILIVFCGYTYLKNIKKL